MFKEDRSRRLRGQPRPNQMPLSIPPTTRIKRNEIQLSVEGQGTMVQHMPGDTQSLLGKAVCMSQPTRTMTDETSGLTKSLSYRYHVLPANLLNQTNRRA